MDGPDSVEDGERAESFKGCGVGGFGDEFVGAGGEKADPSACTGVPGAAGAS